VFGDDRRATGAGAATEAGDNEKGVNLVYRNAIDGRLDLVDILLGDLRAELVVRADTVALDPRLTDQDALLLGDPFQPHQIRFRGVDRDRRADDVGVRFRVVLEEPVNDLTTGLSEADHREFHVVPSLSIGRKTVPSAQ